MNYTNGKIYTIKNKNDPTLIYVGSTIQPLSTRFTKHKYDSKNKKSKLYDTVNNDWSDWYIELHSLYPCDNKTELFKYEGKIIQEIGTLNTFIAGRTRKEYKKHYRLNNREIFNEKQKQYRLDNKKILNEKRKQYRLKKKNELLSKTCLPQTTACNI